MPRQATHLRKCHLDIGGIIAESDEKEDFMKSGPLEEGQWYLISTSDTTKEIFERVRRGIVGFKGEDYTHVKYYYTGWSTEWGTYPKDHGNFY